MGRYGNAALRLLQSLLAAGNMGLSTYVLSWYRMRSSQSEPSSITFILVASIFSVISIFYLELGPRIAAKLAPLTACLIVEGINTIFYFAGFIAFTVFLSSLKVCSGRVCNVSQADSAIAAVAFCAWAASTIITAKVFIKGNADGRRRNGSQMRQL